MPGGNWILNVQVKSGPTAGQVAFGSTPVSKWFCGRALKAVSVAPLSSVLELMKNRIDCVADDTYDGRRSFALLAFGPGIVMWNVASASGPVYSGAVLETGAGWGSELLREPPPHPAKRAHVMIAEICRSSNRIRSRESFKDRTRPNPGRPVFETKDADSRDVLLRQAGSGFAARAERPTNSTISAAIMHSIPDVMNATS